MNPAVAGYRGCTVSGSFGFNRWKQNSVTRRLIEVWLCSKSAAPVSYAHLHFLIRSSHKVRRLVLPLDGASEECALEAKP